MYFARSSIIPGVSILLLFLSLFSATAAQSINTLKEQAQKGDAEAQDNLGHAYANGEDVPHDFAQAVVWFRKAAEQGNADAQYNLGVAYYQGQGVPRDYAKALVWYRKAAEQGHAGAQFMLGAGYALGRGVPQNYAKAYFWGILAAAGELPDEVTFEDIAHVRDIAASHLTRSVLLQTQERARKWTEAHAAK